MAKTPWQALAPANTEVHEVQYVQASVEALAEEMRRDPTIFYMGQGIGPRGGNFMQTKGLCAEFGEERLRDTPISELGQVGLGIGAALAGRRAVVDLVFLDMVMEAMGQIVEQAATIHYMSAGQFNVPIVVRAAMGTVRQAGPHHSRCFYSWFAHIPGLKVVLPSTPEDVKGLMKTALRDDNPVVFIEHKLFYNKRGPVPNGEYTIPFGKARRWREGTDATVIGISAMLWKVMEAAEALAAEGISIEVLDPRTIMPLDREAILESVKKTGRLIIVDEAQAFCGFAAEVAALVCEEALEYLDAPVQRVCSLHTPYPFNPVLEDAMLPSVEKIVAGVHRTLGR